MKEASDQAPLACNLPDSEFRKREATLLTEFKSAVIGVEERPDGYVFRFPAGRKHLAALADLIAAERECCPFLGFRLDVEPYGESVVLYLSGPADSKEFLKATFCP
jgi:hypothetical protein